MNLPIAISWPWTKQWALGRYIQLDGEILELESRGRYVYARTAVGSHWRVYRVCGVMVGIRRKAT